MSNCSNHKKDLYGESDMKKVAEAIGDLHYETLAQLLKALSQKLKQDSRKDWKSGRVRLANLLKEASVDIKNSYTQIVSAYQISKPFMEDKK
jgi:hypothetical protein